MLYSGFSEVKMSLSITKARIRVIFALCAIQSEVSHFTCSFFQGKTCNSFIFPIFDAHFGQYENEPANRKAKLYQHQGT